MLSFLLYFLFDCQNDVQLPPFLFVIEIDNNNLQWGGVVLMDERSRRNCKFFFPHPSPSYIHIMQHQTAPHVTHSVDLSPWPDFTCSCQKRWQPFVPVWVSKLLSWSVLNGLLSYDWQTHCSHTFIMFLADYWLWVQFTCCLAFCIKDLWLAPKAWNKYQTMISGRIAAACKL